MIKTISYYVHSLNTGRWVTFFNIHPQSSMHGHVGMHIEHMLRRSDNRQFVCATLKR